MHHLLGLSVIKTSVLVVLFIKQTKNMSESCIQWFVVEI